MTGRAASGRYVYQAGADARGAVSVTCQGCERLIRPDEPIYVSRDRFIFFGDGYVTGALPVGPWCASCEGDAPHGRPWKRAGRDAWENGHFRWIPAPPRTCRTCGRLFYACATRWCSDRCENAERTERRREAREQARSRHWCRECGERFTPPRADARYCSPACRQKAYRKRQAEQAAAAATMAAVLRDYSDSLNGGTA